MSIFPRFAHNEFSPLFRLFDDYERSMQTMDDRLRAFTPKFDVKEKNDSYELSGEFPGVEQKDINIEWTDSQTLSIHGRHEEVKEEGQRPSAGFIEGEAKSDRKGKQPTVEDEGAQTQVAKKGGQEMQKKSDMHEPKYWVSERSVGEFHRSFAFPSPVDQDAVKASLKNGILNITVPKMQKKEPRRVKIEVPPQVMRSSTFAHITRQTLLITQAPNGGCAIRVPDPYYVFPYSYRVFIVSHGTPDCGSVRSFHPREFRKELGAGDMSSWLLGFVRVLEVDDGAEPGLMPGCSDGGVDEVCRCHICV